jgi:hypothetical protein
MRKYPKHYPTFAELAAAEPELARLLDRAKAFRRSRRRVSDDDIMDEWYGPRQWERNPGLRGQVVRLVGSMRKDGDPILRTVGAYDVAYDTIFDALNGRGRHG